MFRINIDSIKINNFFLNLFLISILLFKIPNFYFLPFLKHSLLTTQSFSRIAILLCFLYMILTFFQKDKYIILQRGNKKTIFLIIFLFIIQSLSILVAGNIVSFWVRYKDVSIGLISFFVFMFYKKHLKKIVIILFISVLINGLYQSVIVFFNHFYKNFIAEFVYDKQLTNVLININRGRIFTDTYDEIVISLLFLPSATFNKKITNFFLYLIISLFAFLSNWRIRITMLIMNTFGSIIIFKKILKTKLTLYLISLLIIAYFTHIFLLNIVKISFYNRFIYPSEKDVFSINSRYTQVLDSFNLGSISLLGVGLGNFYDNLPSSKKYFYETDKLQNELGKLATEYPHNIIALTMAESGILGLAFLISILFFFIKNDINLLKKGTNEEKAFLLSFWTLFLYGFINPPIPGSYQVLFWGIRGILL